MELMPLDDEEKTKHKEKEVSLKKTNRRESRENNKLSAKRPRRERREKTKFEGTRLDTIKQKGSPHKNRRKHKNDCARKRKCKRNKDLRSKPSYCNYKKAQGLDNIVIDK